jgi:hypothetical protein
MIYYFLNKYTEIVMKKTGLSQWIKPSLIAFAVGAIVIGPLDFFHAWTGVETYLDAPCTVTTARWPVYLPLQMGCIGMGALLLWVLFRMYVADRLLGAESLHRLSDRIVIPLCMVMVAGGYFLSAMLLGSENQPGIFFTLYTCSLTFVLLFMSGHQAAAFVLVGFAGTVAEALLLSPSINYYEFAHKELFSRAPSWLPFVYGWVGVFIHRISRGIG